MAVYTLTINVLPSSAWGSVTADPPSSEGYDDLVYDNTLLHTPILTATPNAGYVFAYWTGEITGNTNPAPGLHMTADFTVNAYFAETNTEVVTVQYPSVVESEFTVPVNDIAGAIMKDSPATYADYTEQANEDTANDVNLLPSALANGDGFFFGVNDIDYDILRYVIDIGTAGVGTWGLTYYYWNGAWTALPAANVLLKSNQFLDFKTSGLGSLWIVPPSDWVTTDVNGVTKYWLESRVIAYSAKTTIPLANRVYGHGQDAGLFLQIGDAWKSGIPYLNIGDAWKAVESLRQAITGNAKWESISTETWITLATETWEYALRQWKVVI